MIKVGNAKIEVIEGDYSECDVCGKEMSPTIRHMIVVYNNYGDTCVYHVKCARLVQRAFTETLDEIKKVKLIKKISGI
jgi:hypothetical protein